MNDSSATTQATPLPLGEDARRAGEGRDAPSWITQRDAARPLIRPVGTFSRKGRRVLLGALICFAAFCSAASAKETLVKNVAEFDAAVKAAKAGDEIVMADGEWRDVDLHMRGHKVGGWFIILRAQTPGKVVLTGTSRLRISGYSATVRGLLWKDSAAVDDVISFRLDSKNLAHKCHLEDCAILGDMPGTERKWVSLYGTDNFVVNCRFEGKRSGGTLFVVWLDDEPGSHGGHYISENFFGPRERLGKNGGEIIRVGDSKTSLITASCTITDNYFYRCSGEAEIISNKSCGNSYGGNMFVGCGGALTLRHGNRCSVYTNYFFGDGQKGIGGVRVIGENHSVFMNVFHGLTGDDTRAALSLMNGLVDSPANGYFQVRGAQIRFNDFIDCKESIVIGNADKDQKQQTLPPLDCNFVGNRVAAGDRPVFVVRTEPLNFTGENNRYAADSLGCAGAPGWTPIAREELTSQQVLVATEHRKPLLPSETGPEWMRPGDEFLPEALKPAKKTDATPK